MKRLYFLVFIFFLPACGLTQNSDKIIEVASNDNTLFFEINEHIIQLTHSNMEESSTCPKFELLSKDKKHVLDSLEACSIRVPGYREFHAAKDFAFIEFSNYQLKSGYIYYEIDLVLLQGNEFLVSCEIRLKQQKLVQGDCKKI